MQAFLILSLQDLFILFNLADESRTSPFDGLSHRTYHSKIGFCTDDSSR